MIWVIYEGKDGWRWRLWSRNRKIVGDSGEGYSSKGAVKKAIRRIEWAFAHCSAPEIREIPIRQENAPPVKTAKP